MTITSKDYGYTQDGRKVKQFRLENSSGMSVSVIEYGCTVTNIRVKDKNGDLRDVVLGYDTLRDYERAGASMGAFVGRCANRIENARFEIDGVTTQLERNEGRNHLHGSFSRKLYESSIEDDKLVLRMNSPEGDDGFPGNMEVTVTYSLTEENSFVMEYSAVTDAPTLANFTNHSYFNLNGHDSGTVLGQKLRIASDTFTEIGEGLCTTGRFLPTGGTPFDFETEKEIGRDMDDDCEQMRLAGGYDHNFVIDKTQGMLGFAASAYSPETGIRMDTYTTQPGVQLYTGNFLGGETVLGKGGCAYPKHGGFCLETQHYPCTPSHDNFPPIVLRPGEEYHEATAYKFTLE